MSSSGSVTHWLALLKAGDAAAAQPLWERYFRRLVGLARLKLQGAPRQAADEEDAALSAFDSFCRAAEAGRFPRLDDRDDLSQVLLLLTARKALRQKEREQAQKRGAGRMVSEADLAQLIGDEPTPEFAAQVSEEYRRLLDLLGEQELRAVVGLKVEGYTTQEIARHLQCSPRTVERKLERIRSIWAAEVQS
jgi:RNA polymerase sigma factor (sigma-70 family)